MTEVPSDPRQELGDIQILYPELLDVDQCSKSAKNTAIEQLRGKSIGVIVGSCVDLELLDQRKQPKRLHV